MLLATLVLVVQAQPYFYEDFQDTDLMDDYQVCRRLQRFTQTNGIAHEPTTSRAPPSACTHHQLTHRHNVNSC